MTEKYNYVYFNATYADKLVVDLDDYNAICTRDLEKIDNIQVVPCIMAHKSKLFRFIYYCFEKVLRNINKRPLRLWFPYFFKNKFKKSKYPLCIIIATSQLPIEYVKWLKNKYPTAKFVRIHRDLYKVDCRNGYTVEFLKSFFDVEMTFDEKEAVEHGALYFDEIESKIDISESINYPEFDVFFAGKAKDRLPRILEALKLFNSVGLNCYFYVTGVPINQQVDIKGIVYGKRLMSFREMLYRTVRSKCILEINQEGAIGYTSRFIEAVIYNKKLITDNLHIKQSKFYNPKYIQCIAPGGAIDVNFVGENVDIDYGYDNEFSPINLINKLDNYFAEKDNKKGEIYND